MNSPYTTFTSTPSRRATLIGFGAFGIATLAGCAPSIKSVQNSPSNSSSSSSSSASSTSSPSDSTSPEEYAKFVADWNKYVGDIKLPTKDKGGYTPATNTEPAKNVPEPDIDENAIRQKTLEGSYKALAAYEASFLYAVLTGNSEYAKKLSHEDDPNLRPQFDLYRDIYNGGGWMEGYDLKCWIRDKRPTVVFESDIVAVAWNYGEKFEAYKAHLSKEEVADQPADTADNIYMVTIYDGGSWKYVTNTYLKQKYPQLVESGNSSSSAT
ncbi:DUF6318 family protein [Rothia dentocariosa]|jgi:hypothetical protein HMPREF0733_12082|uniref:DUF6318 family protein n=1 Tax=Rothia dentocariosa TaxID=2047 RepID=UPI0011AE5FDA|nr:DUF6318 family protein [Rothia dentocariosa]